MCHGLTFSVVGIRIPTNHIRKDKLVAQNANGENSWDDGLEAELVAPHRVSVDDSGEAGDVLTLETYPELCTLTVRRGHSCVVAGEGGGVRKWDEGAELLGEVTRLPCIELEGGHVIVGFKCL